MQQLESANQSWVEVNDRLAAQVAEHNESVASLYRRLGQIMPCLDELPRDEQERLREIVDSVIIVPKALHAPIKYLSRKAGGSFRLQRMTHDAIQTKSLAHRLENKLIGKAFCRRLNVPTPRTFANGVASDRLRLSWKTPFVIKPRGGSQSKGVFGIVPQRTGLRDVFNGVTYDGVESLRAALVRAMQHFKLNEDAWIVEEMVSNDACGGGPSDDVKVFAFYGEICLVLQMPARWEGGPHHIFFTPEGTVVDTGQQGPPEGISLEPRFSRRDLQTAARISRQIPYPFVRIDFLVRGERLVFNEFTLNAALPGNFNKQYDRILGEAWVRAESRLLNDMVLGKRFTKFRRALSLSTGQRAVRFLRRAVRERLRSIRSAGGHKDGHAAHADR